MIRFRRSQLTPALWLHFRGTGKFSRLIRWAQKKMYKRHCKRHHIDTDKIPWGNHDGRLIRYRGSLNWFCGESLAKLGAVRTPIEEIERQMNAGTLECRVYEVVGMTNEQGDEVCQDWIDYIEGKPYDYWAYPRLITKALLMNWEEWPWPFSYFGKKAAGSKWDDWCTESANDAGRIRPPRITIIYSDNPIPLHVEEVAGELPCDPPRKITLHDITYRVIVGQLP